MKWANERDLFSFRTCSQTEVHFTVHRCSESQYILTVITAGLMVQILDGVIIPLQRSNWLWNHDCLATKNRTRSHQLFILSWHSSTTSLWSSQGLKSQSAMIRGRCGVVRRGWAVGDCGDQSKMEEGMFQQDGQNFGIVRMVLWVRHGEGFWEKFCHLFLKYRIKLCFVFQISLWLLWY